MATALAQRLVEAGAVLAAAGLDDFTRGHASVRCDDGTGRFLVKPHGIGLGEMTPETLVLCDPEGNRLEGGRRHSETEIHAAILRARSDLAAVVHVHPTYATAFSLAARPWRFVSQSCAHFIDGVARYAGDMDLIRTREQGDAVARAMGALPAVLLRAHGVAVGGRTLEEAVLRTITLEKACHDQFLAHLWGDDGMDADRAALESLHASLEERPERHTQNFDYLLRRARA